MTIPACVVEATKGMFCEQTRSAVRKLSEIYEFPLEEALDKLAIGDSAKKKAKVNSGGKMDTASKKMPKIPLPWCGVIIESNCCGVRYNKGLFTQCLNRPAAGCNFCSACSETSKRIICCGDIRQRSNADWTDAKGRAPTRYCLIMEKLGISQSDAVAAAHEVDWTIPEFEFEKPKPARRGRPPKKKPLVSNSLGNDMLDELVAGARDMIISDESLRERPIPVGETRREKMERLFGSNSDTDEEAYDLDTESDAEIMNEPEERKTVPLVIGGIEYLFDESTNTAYDLNTQDKVGQTTPGRTRFK